MSKKKNKKFKKKYHGGSQVASIDQPAIINQPNAISPAADLPLGTPTSPSPATIKPESATSGTEHDYSYVKNDVIKIVIVLVSLAIIVVAIYFVQTKTPILQNLGNWIYKILDFNIG
jgi:hypothetical protein